jgi:DNA mismatch repair protein MutS
MSLRRYSAGSRSGAALQWSAMKKQTGAEPITLAFSLLWPKGRQKSGAVPLVPGSADDLDVKKLVEFMAADPRKTSLIQEVFKDLCQDPETINYRLDVLEDLLNCPALNECWNSLMPVLSELRYYSSHQNQDNWSDLVEVIWRLRELEHYIRCVTDLGKTFSSLPGLRSQGLGRLRERVAEIEKDPTYRKLCQELPALLVKINSLQSITIGVNLNAGLLPCEATLLSVNSEKFTDGPFFDKLIGRGEWKGIAPLHRAPNDSEYLNPLMIPLFKDIAEIMRKSIKPIAKALKDFISINSRLFVKLQEDFIFFLGAVRLVNTLLRRGLPMTRPGVAEKEKRMFATEGLYNINLALRMLGSGPGEAPGAAGERLSDDIIKNDFRLDDRGRIAILTGPNRGGKTTILQAVGLAQIMMQVGLYVPAERAELSIADNILTHYPAKEDLEGGTGRFGEEAQRLRDLFTKITRGSLVLLNETLSSTSMGESIFLAVDLVRVLRLMGMRALYTTHLHQLAANIERINKGTRGDSLLFSLVALVKKEEDPEALGKPGRKAGFKITPTFKIVAGPPEGRSYALDLAKRFGISREQLLAQLRERGELKWNGKTQAPDAPQAAEEQP